MVDQDAASKLVLALERMIPAAKAAELPETARILAEAIGVVAYEGAQFRIPRCTKCSLPRSDDATVRRINRDRA